ncbi:MAG: hypothetical protein HY010_01870 [Acidobacteria bacterium]|nr:hypothetical protein [Acidobacteriota bacterium]
MSADTYYAVLGIPETATQDEIQQAYRDFVRAFGVLSDSAQRLTYDQELAQRRKQDAPVPQPLATPPLVFLDQAQSRARLQPIRPNWGVWAALLILGTIWSVLFGAFERIALFYPMLVGVLVLTVLLPRLLSSVAKQRHEL